MPAPSFLCVDTHCSLAAWCWCWEVVGPRAFFFYTSAGAPRGRHSPVRPLVRRLVLLAALRTKTRRMVLRLGRRILPPYYASLECCCCCSSMEQELSGSSSMLGTEESCLSFSFRCRSHGLGCAFLLLWRERNPAHWMQEFPVIRGSLSKKKLLATSIEEAASFKFKLSRGGGHTTLSAFARAVWTNWRRWTKVQSAPRISCSLCFCRIFLQPLKIRHPAYHSLETGRCQRTLGSELVLVGVITVCQNESTSSISQSILLDGGTMPSSTTRSELVVESSLMRAAHVAQCRFQVSAKWREK